MKQAVLALFVLGCAGPTRLAATPLLSELPDDRREREALLDSSHARPTKESRKTLSPTMQKVENAAATAAAVVGYFFSTTKTVVIGTQTPMEEMNLFPGSLAPLVPQSDDDDREPPGTEEALPPPPDWLILPAPVQD